MPIVHFCYRTCLDINTIEFATLWKWIWCWLSMSWFCIISFAWALKMRIYARPSKNITFILSLNPQKDLLLFFSLSVWHHLYWHTYSANQLMSTYDWNHYQINEKRFYAVSLFSFYDVRCLIFVNLFKRVVMMSCVCGI